MVKCHDDICSQKQRTPKSPNTCKGITHVGQPCKVSVVSDTYCHHHKEQRTGENIYGIPMQRKKNSSNDNDGIDELDYEMRSLSLNKSPSTRNDSKTKNNVIGSTYITINHKNKNYQISGEKESITSQTKKKVLTSTKWEQTDTHNKLQTPQRGDDNFETANKGFPTLTLSFNASPLESLIEKHSARQQITYKELCEVLETPYQSPIRNVPDIKSPMTPTTPTRTSKRSSCINESNESITDNQNMTHTDLTNYDRSSSPTSSLQNKTVKLVNQKIQASEEIVNIEEELEKTIYVPGKAILKWIRFGEWIKQDLSPETRRSLKSEMEKPIADKDEPGPNSEEMDKYTFYKVGRTSNVHRRLYQWAKRCGYKPKLIEEFPSSKDSEGGEGSRINVERTKCKYTHRAERLIHIELTARFKADVEKCESCGRSHREWFKASSDVNDEFVLHRWDDVREVITHWITFVEKVYGTG
ncbi:5831_t:CDS:2 [Funneliformis caledonium]|uniref:5831_t:CDS:1 n=1 Tax=Funneliformis caledonium TaxID=1117310 RepID=A0A9N9F418_9GLOM|nr:5831_t:CDS:2 [Funneliformis caledonium]